MQQTRANQPKDVTLMTTSDCTSNIPYGYCQCGCGQKTPISKTTDKKYGRIKGEPHKYINGHLTRFSDEQRILMFWSRVNITADDNQCW